MKKTPIEQNSLKDNRMIKIAKDEYMDNATHTNEFHSGLKQMTQFKTIEKMSQGTSRESSTEMNHFASPPKHCIRVENKVKAKK